MHRSTTIYKQNQSEPFLYKYTRQQRMDFFTGENIIMDYGLVFWSEATILSQIDLTWLHFTSDYILYNWVCDE